MPATATKTRPAASKSKDAAFRELHARAHEAGEAAASGARVTPMIVGEETSLFSGRIDYTKQTYFVEGGPCGFAWVQVKPGNSAFAKWLVANRLARPDSYYGGVCMWVSAYGQSMQRKMAYAGAYAAVIEAAGVVKTVYADSRMD